MNGKIEITVNGSPLTVKTGDLLSEVLGLEKPCGGHGSCGKCRVKINGRDELACQYTVTAPIEVRFEEKGEILSVSGVSESGRATEHSCLALDIGTTTLVLALVSLDEKRAVRVTTAANPQRRYGADIMTRIEFCGKNSVKELHECLVSEINSMIDRLGASGIDTIYVSGNVTMLHTLFGVDCSSIGIAPYKPAFLESRSENGEKLGLKAKNVISLPSVSSFVGADIVAGLNYIGMPEKGKYNLLVDLGTNAEIVLFSERSALATAAAAGPCFEGANIKHGMSATAGAVYSFEISDKNASFKTISGSNAKGICGTGLIDIVSELLINGLIDETGYMENDYYLTPDICLCREDVREYQLAKSAVYSAVLSLIRTEGVSIRDISRMYISGGFSANINMTSAVRSGLLPASLADKGEFLNNSSLLGTVRYACGEDDTARFIEITKYVDLSQNPYFAELFVENMMFGE